MRILHIELAGFYNEGMLYQTNLLVRENIKDGNIVRIISSNYEWKQDIVLRVSSGISETAENAELVRVPYLFSRKHFSLHKVRAIKNLYSLIDDFRPDVILSHDLCYLSVFDVIRYKKKHPEVKLYADTHTAGYNSGLNWFSLHILHRLFYRGLIQNTLPYLDRYFYIGESEKFFSIKHYGVPESIMEYYPLGGMLYSDNEYTSIRKKYREELGMKENQRLYIHSGKLSSSKRTADLIEAYSAVNDENSRLVIIGSVPEETKNIIIPLINKDKRIKYLGWKSGDELRAYLCASDLYCQPGSVSATMQNAICCNCAIMAYPHLPYTTHLDWGNILWVETQEDMEKVFESIANNPGQLDELKINSNKCATELLDYRKLAARLYK